MSFSLEVCVEWESIENLMTILVTYIKINDGVYVTIYTSSPICIQHSGPNDDVIKMATKVLHMHLYKHLDSKHKLCGNLLLELSFCPYLIDLVSYDMIMTCLFFLIPGTRFGALDSIKLT